MGTDLKLFKKLGTIKIRGVMGRTGGKWAMKNNGGRTSPTTIISRFESRMRLIPFVLCLCSVLATVSFHICVACVACGVIKERSPLVP